MSRDRKGVGIGNGQSVLIDFNEQRREFTFRVAPEKVEGEIVEEESATAGAGAA